MAVRTPAPLPVRGIYGYVLYVSCYVGLALYLVWAYVPNCWLEAAGVTYLPNKYWAISIPVYVLTAVLLFATCLYPGYIFLATPLLDSQSTLTDKYTVYKHKNTVPLEATPPIMDLDISEVCKALYLDG